MASRPRRLVIMAGAAITILAVPLVAMAISDEVDWGIGDFAIAASLLLGVVLIAETVLRRFLSPPIRVLLIGLVVAVVLVVWIELAVGLLSAMRTWA